VRSLGVYVAIILRRCHGLPILTGPCARFFPCQWKNEAFTGFFLLVCVLL
jgi:hypothetical protein